MQDDPLSQTVIVFDLDDTLYPEASYLRSGMKYVCDKLATLFQTPFQDRLDEAVAAGEVDWLDFLCHEAGLPVAAKEALLWSYRLHPPSIGLSPSCAAMLSEVERRAKAVAILTDGRSLTQRLKVTALRLSHIPLYISEDYGSEKPDPLRFRLIEERWSADRYVYIGDNPRKDFQACNELGWWSVGVANRGDNIHCYEVDSFPRNALPQYWIAEWKELFSILC